MKPPDKIAEPKARIAALDAMFAALSHPARRQILMTIHFRGGSMTSGEIAARFAHAWPTTTRHLRALEEAKLLTVSQEGRSRVYHLERAQLRLVTEWVAWFEK
ncbi:MAG TPA: metalloregulator ArsR/SmtB family transcription factor [Thermoanaerobaculia bacterium]